MEQEEKPKTKEEKEVEDMLYKIQQEYVEKIKNDRQI